MKHVKPPTNELIDAACKQFDDEARLVEESLAELFGQYPRNTDPHHVLLKVVALNFLYSTQIRAYTKTTPNVIDMALHIASKGAEVDSCLEAGEPGIVDWISSLTVEGKRHRNFFSFASKYCSWHRPEAYPIYDIRVVTYLQRLQRQQPFSAIFKPNGDIGDYAAFRALVDDFRNHFGLGSRSLKEIDKFLWMYGGDSAPSESLPE